MACFVYASVRCRAHAHVCMFACLGDASLTSHYLINYYHFIILFFVFWQLYARRAPRIVQSPHSPHSSLMCKRLNMTFLLPPSSSLSLAHSIQIETRTKCSFCFFVYLFVSNTRTKRKTQQKMIIK